ncbi:TAXI family TRAP transporter solute-binding subunit [Limimaricola cinnabarinus]|uniref:TRAP transporter solute receptor, TAXI family n=1 Tax=Limimaricola cinnabarinus LL-001 TaxID=1337093 RepID=U2Z1X8_9RHOB|nr:TAXI family TRAP transporter solute-binding subunit [Limimaricola cinnabarinus]GAD55350.1 TRAP transporter solute receptor, TAXI family precursor [Limimaricola cinnabarinus LL-001]
MKLGTISTLSLALLAAGTAQAQDTRLLIGSTSASSSQYGYFVALGQLINDTVPEVSASVAETGATMDNLRRMQRGQVDLGLVTTNIIQHAWNGTQEFDGAPQEAPLLWVYSPAPQNVVVREDVGIDSLADLAGQRFNPGIRGSATEATAESVFATLGIAPDWVRGSTTDVVDMIKDNRVGGYVKSGAGSRLDASSLDISTFTPIEVISLTDEQVAMIEAEMPDISVVEITEAGEGIAPYKTWSFALAVSATPEMDEEIAYQITKAAMQDETVQRNALAALAEYDLTELTMQYGTVPLHPGAARYFEEQGVEIPERMRPAQ